MIEQGEEGLLGFGPVGQQVKVVEEDHIEAGVTLVEGLMLIISPGVDKFRGEGGGTNVP